MMMMILVIMMMMMITTHRLVHALASSDLLRPGDVDGVVKVMMMIMIMIMMMMLMMMMKLVTDMALTEMFSGVAEEKEVRMITGKVMEARGSKCYDMLQIMARFISNDQVMMMMMMILMMIMMIIMMMTRSSASPSPSQTRQLN